MRTPRLWAPGAREALGDDPNVYEKSPLLYQCFRTAGASEPRPEKLKGGPSCADAAGTATQESQREKTVLSVRKKESSARKKRKARERV